MPESMFVELFGTEPRFAAWMWKRTADELPTKLQHPKHLLWALAFLKLHNTEPALAASFHTNKRTFRDAVWPTIRSVSYLDLVSLPLCECESEFDHEHATEV
jgi:hypothetical protein